VKPILGEGGRKGPVSAKRGDFAGCEAGSAGREGELVGFKTAQKRPFSSTSRASHEPLHLDSRRPSPNATCGRVKEVAARGRGTHDRSPIARRGQLVDERVAGLKPKGMKADLVLDNEFCSQYIGFNHPFGTTSLKGPGSRWTRVFF
jgi:hypothetical protein